MHSFSRFTLGMLLLGCLFTQPVFADTQSDSITRVIGNTVQAEKLPGVTTTPSRILPAYWQKFPTGTSNSITDVPNVQVGHVSLLREQAPTIRTGVTAIVPKVNSPNGNIATTGFPAAVSVLNGNGEMTGVFGIQNSGFLNGPIILTNTASVGIANLAVWQYFQQTFPHQWESELPVVGECWDGFFNSMQTPALTSSDVITAIQSVNAQPVLQGRIGAGTGMRSFGLHAGIGSASRKVTLEKKEYTIGVLVNTNHSQLSDLTPLFQNALESHWKKSLSQIQDTDNSDRAKQPQTNQRQGSIIIIIATDLPLSQLALQQIADHAALGIAQTGGTMNTTSGDFALAFSTANAVLMNEQAPQVYKVDMVHPKILTPVFQATIEAVVEAQLNALVASHANL